MKLRIKAPVNLGPVLNHLEELGPSILQSIRATLDLENELTVGEVQEEKLSKRGPKTLGVVTNRLRLSVARFRAKVVGDRVTSSIGTNVVYGGAHEFGVNKTVTVQAHQRRVPRGLAATRPGASANDAAQVANVRSHQRKINMPARRMFGSTLEDRQGDYSESLDTGILATMRA